MCCSREGFVKRDEQPDVSTQKRVTLDTGSKQTLVGRHRHTLAHSSVCAEQRQCVVLSAATRQTHVGSLLGALSPFGTCSQFKHTHLYPTLNPSKASQSVKRHNNACIITTHTRPPAHPYAL